MIDDLPTYVILIKTKNGWRVHSFNSDYREAKHIAETESVGGHDMAIYSYISSCQLVRTVKWED